MQTAVGKVLWGANHEYPAARKFGRLFATPVTGARIASEAQNIGHHP
jgi:hypothetical protein